MEFNNIFAKCADTIEHLDGGENIQIKPNIFEVHTHKFTFISTNISASQNSQGFLKYQIFFFSPESIPRLLVYPTFVTQKMWAKVVK